MASSLSVMETAIKSRGQEVLGLKRRLGLVSQLWYLLQIPPRLNVLGLMVVLPLHKGAELEKPCLDFRMRIVTIY